MGLSSAGVGSGLDVDSIVTQLMNVERQPLTRLQTQETSYNAKLTAYGTLKSALSTFQTAVRGLTDVAKFSATSATVGNTDIATATVAANASAGNFSLEVSQLAQGQKLATAGQASINAPIGSGTLTFDFGTISGGTFSDVTGTYTGASYVSGGAGAKTLTIDSSNNTLAGLRDAINGAKMGVTATIVNDGGASPYRLALTTSTGKANSLKITSTGDPALSSLLAHDPAGTQALSQKQAAQNAEFKLDGIAISKTSNTVSDAIAGVTLTLKKSNVGTPTNINIALDSNGITTAVKQFVDGYNALNKSLRSLTAYDDVAKKGAILTGDATARSVQSSLRAVLGTAVNGGDASFATLSQIGVAQQKDGTLAVDSTKLQNAITNDFSKITGLFAAVGNAADDLVSYQGITKNTKTGTYGVEVTRLATQGTLTAQNALTLPTVISAGVNDTLQVLLDNQTQTITLSPGSYASADALAAEIQTRINGVPEFSKTGSTVSVTQSGGVLSLLSKRFGSTSRIEISGGTAKADLFGTPTATSGFDVAGKINGVAATGSGQSLTGASGNDADGLKILIDGGALGSRGTITFSKGYATHFDDLIAAQLDTGGSLAAVTDGINSSLKQISKSKETLNLRLAATEKRIRAQYTALDTTMSKLTSTGNSLASQLSGLSSYL
jgi:flagellar hook-associated protein 2